MRTVVIFLVLVAVAIAALFLGGVFDSQDGNGAADATDGSDGATDGTDPGSALTGEGGTAAAPKERPALQQLRMPADTKVLILGAIPNTADQFMRKLLTGRFGASFQGWYLNPTNATPLNESKGLPALDSVPTGLTLNEFDYNVVVLSNVDPKDLSDDFWGVLASRVKSGQTNVLWRTWPPYPGGDTDTPATDHPWLEHAVVSKLIPVTEILPLRGVIDDSGRSTLPGQFGSAGTRFLVTAKGESHPASRLVMWPDWSRVWWDELSTGKGAVRVKFCAPVTKLAEGATALLTVDVKEGDDYPVLVAGNVGDGRVLWLGTRELSWDAFYDPPKEGRVGVVLHNMIAWLAGAK